MAQAEDQRTSEVDKHLVAARYAMAQRQWTEARTTYSQALQLSPKNVEAREAIAKIDEHLAKARGGLSIATDPPGAIVYRIGSNASAREELGKTPFKGSDLPLGKLQLVVEKEGYEPLQQDAEIGEDRTAALGLLTLQRSTGTLQIVTKPEGAEWELEGSNISSRKGTTPATVKDLPTGDYRVHLRRPGWPEAVREVKVERDAVASTEWEFAEGKVNITSAPAGVEIFRRIAGDDKKSQQSLGKTPLSVELPTGRQELIARYKEWPEQQRTIDVTTTAHSQTEFKFQAGNITITSQPSGALINQGKKELGKTPLALKQLMPQDYTYTLSLKGYKDRTLEATVEPQMTREVSAILEENPTASLNEGERILLGTWRPVDGQGSITFSVSENGKLQASGHFTSRGTLPGNMKASGTTHRHSGRVNGFINLEKGSDWQGNVGGSYNWHINPSEASRDLGLKVINTSGSEATLSLTTDGRRFRLSDPHHGIDTFFGPAMFTK